jgi:Leucine-rich repeat (LRR) protein
VFQVGDNQLTSLPAEIGQLTQLEALYVRDSNQLDRDLTSSLSLGRQQPAQMAAGRAGPVAEAHASLGATLVPLDVVADLPSTLQLSRNPLPTIAGLTFDDTYDSAEQCALRVNEIIAATTHIGMIRELATEICIGLQSLELPAFVTLTILDEAVHENSIRMWAKWELITAVKHYQDRRSIESWRASA